MKAVTYDFWNTLMWEAPGTIRAHRREAIEDLMDEFGIELQAGDVERELIAISELQREGWESGRLFQPADGAAHFGEAIADGRLTATQRKQVEEAIFLLSSEPELNLADGIGAVLERLKGAGIRLSIVCDVGLTPSTILRRNLEKAGILEFFDGWAFSDEVGHYKPARQIFEHALEGVGSAPADAAHVGDLKRTDVAGSRAMGMTSVRYRGVLDDTGDCEEADHVIGDHTQIFEALAIR